MEFCLFFPLVVRSTAWILELSNTYKETFANIYDYHTGISNEKGKKNQPRCCSLQKELENSTFHAIALL